MRNLFLQNIIKNLLRKITSQPVLKIKKAINNSPIKFFIKNYYTIYRGFYFNYHTEISRNVQKIQKNVSNKNYRVRRGGGGYDWFDLGWRRQDQVKVTLNFLNETFQLLLNI